jgi:hypothetical protein
VNIPAAPGLLPVFATHLFNSLWRLCIYNFPSTPTSNQSCFPSFTQPLTEQHINIVDAQFTRARQRLLLHTLPPDTWNHQPHRRRVFSRANPHNLLLLSQNQCVRSRLRVHHSNSSNAQSATSLDTPTHTRVDAQHICYIHTGDQISKDGAISSSDFRPGGAGLAPTPGR